MHLHLVDAVFKRIADRYFVVRELALLADRHEAGGELVRDRAAKDETARLDACHFVDFCPGPGVDKFIDGAAEGARVAEQRGDITKQNARLWMIRDSADRASEIVFKRHAALETKFRRVRRRRKSKACWRENSRT